MPGVLRFRRCPHCGGSCREAQRTPGDWRQERDARIKRAEETLLAILDATNQKRYSDGLPIRVTGSAGGRYEIQRGYSGNVQRLGPAGAPIASYCAHPPMNYNGMEHPVQVAMIAQILALRNDEPGFLRVAVPGIPL